MVQPARPVTRFELRRQSDGLVYTFERTPRPDGADGYRRQDKDIWIVYRPERGWVAWDDASDSCTGIPWGVLPHEQGPRPPEGDRVSRKGPKSYVYTLVYVD